MNTRKAEDRILVSVAELAEYFGGITTTHVQKLERDGIVKKTIRATYDLKESIQNYIRYLKREGKQVSPGSYEAHRARLYKGRADITETQAAAIKGEFHHGQCIADVMNEAISSARSRLLALPTIAGSRLADISEVNECVAVLTDLIHEALNELTKYDGRAVIARYRKQQIEPEQETDENDDT